MKQHQNKIFSWLDPLDFTIGWICALETEYVAARVFLDDRLGHHNVVIAVLSQGYGTSSAASVATHMIFSFLNIRIGLLVGISGGVPSAQDDIRLGDVVVSVKEHNGLLTATNGLRAQHEIQGHRIRHSDRLYLPHIVHTSGQSSRCTEACGNDSLNLVIRPERAAAEDGIVIHHGLIASGNTVCRDANLRDKFAQKGALCFEMEVAGLINYFPCIVIQGICDYSDSHKNKDWQGYAAMTAAVYAKDLLKHVAPSRIANRVC
ncbi:nucleoside phosphorylase domain-containing protein [Fusarium oxysporum]|nr:nucleoside phosphorylase domain-containing protein [Fusarium oxysporum]